MKRLSALFIVVLTLSSCSCKAAPVQKEFSSRVRCVYNGVRIISDVSSRNHILKINILKPDSLKGYTYSYKGSRLTVTKSGLKLKADKNYLPDSAFASALNNVLKKINRDEATYSGSYNNTAEYKGRCESGDFILASDHNTGYIKSIKIKKLGFSADFRMK